MTSLETVGMVLLIVGGGAGTIWLFGYLFTLPYRIEVEQRRRDKEWTRWKADHDRRYAARKNNH